MDTMTTAMIAMECHFSHNSHGHLVQKNMLFLKELLNNYQRFKGGLWPSELWLTWRSIHVALAFNSNINRTVLANINISVFRSPDCLLNVAHLAWHPVHWLLQACLREHSHTAPLLLGRNAVSPVPESQATECETPAKPVLVTMCNFLVQ